jgi:hypothetical protein
MISSFVCAQVLRHELLSPIVRLTPNGKALDKVLPSCFKTVFRKEPLDFTALRKR